MVESTQTMPIDEAQESGMSDNLFKVLAASLTRFEQIPNPQPYSPEPPQPRTHMSPLPIDVPTKQSGLGGIFDNFMNRQTKTLKLLHNTDYCKGSVFGYPPGKPVALVEQLSSTRATAPRLRSL